MRRDVGDQNSIKLWLPDWFIAPLAPWPIQPKACAAGWLFGYTGTFGYAPEGMRRAQTANGWPNDVS